MGLRPAAGNGHAAAHDLIVEAAKNIESYFSAHSPWPAKVVVEEAGEGDDSDEVFPGGDLSAEPGAGRKKEADSSRKEEEAVIQEVVDLFNGNVVTIRPLRSRGGGSPRRRNPQKER
ncbi:MAG: hypothetical protein V3V62_15710 [bacterium]